MPLTGGYSEGNCDPPPRRSLTDPSYGASSNQAQLVGCHAQRLQRSLRTVAKQIGRRNRQLQSSSRQWELVGGLNAPFEHVNKEEEVSNAVNVGHGGALVESIAFNRRVVGSTPALAAMGNLGQVL